MASLSWMLLLGTVLSFLCCSLKGVDCNKDSAYDRARNCAVYQSCNCNDGKIKELEKCFNLVQNKTIMFAYELALNECNVQVDRLLSFREFLAILCKVPLDVQKVCYKIVNAKVLEYINEVHRSNEREKIEEGRKIERARSCLFPIIAGCLVLPDTCI